MTRTPRAAPAPSASGTPSSVSWSVTARTPTPAAAASSTSAAGAREPSEATVWAWRSAFVPLGGDGVAGEPARLERGDDLRGALLGRLTLGLDVDVRVLRRLVRVAHAGELLDLAGE